ncbi:hypothetical protein VNO77_33096 [Canavalia gladiata]|uniref:Uncharacterized protein n=1 Tax=Canavalia gladiata TaxID=3824 RepID=A0AAN9PW30_CANGL
MLWGGPSYSGWVGSHVVASIGHPKLGVKDYFVIKEDAFNLPKYYITVNHIIFCLPLNCFFAFRFQLCVHQFVSVEERKELVVMCSETSPPRLSFSHDLSELQISPVKQDVPFRDTLLQESNSDFEFSTSRSLESESSSADELFSNGVILPFQIQNKTTARKHSHHVEPHYTKLPPRPCAPSVDKVKKETIRDLLDVSSDHDKRPHSKSLWGFSRSRSLNCDTKKSLVYSLPLLSRSNSTGSVANPKRVSSNKQQSAAKSSSYSCSSTLHFSPMQKSASGKSYGRSYANGLRISPVLNVPTPCVSKGSANLFGLGSFLRVGKVKKSKK